jgi:hypothetical protein
LNSSPSIVFPKKIEKRSRLGKRRILKVFYKGKGGRCQFVISVFLTSISMALEEEEEGLKVARGPWIALK